MSASLQSRASLLFSKSKKEDSPRERPLAKREDVEARVLEGLKSKLLNAGMLAAFVAEYQREWNKLQRETLSDRSTHATDLKSIAQQIDNMVDAISNGMFHPSMKAKMNKLEARKTELDAKLA